MSTEWKIINLSQQNTMLFLPLIFSALASIIVCQTTNLCQPKTTLPDFLQYSHSFEFLANNLNTPTQNLGLDQQFTFTFDKNTFIQGTTPQFAMSIHEYDCSDINSIDYGLSGTINTSSLLIRFQSQGMRWATVNVQVWISARIDILLGHQKFTNPVFNARKLTETIKLPGILPFPDDPNTIFINMITGVKADITASNTQPKYEISLQKLSATLTTYTVEVTTSSETTIKQLSWSYLIVNTANSIFASRGGLMIYPSFGSTPQYINIQPSFAPIRYSLIGLSSIKLAKANKQLKMKMSINSDQILQAKNSGSEIIDEITLIYLTIGVSADQVCSNSNCPGQFIVPSSSQNICQSTCPQNTYIFSQYPRGGKSCLTCSSKINYVLNQQKNGCMCKQGYQMVPGFNRCAQRVSQVVCTEPNTVQSQGKCVCIGGSFNISGVCTICSQTQVFNGSQCVNNNCPNSNETRNSQGVCSCKTGLTRNEKGVCVSNCPLFSLPDPQNSSKCTCISGYFNVSGECRQCVGGRIYRETTQTCECRLNQTFNQTTQKCECNQGLSRMPDGACIKCAPNEFFNGQQCQQQTCKQHQVLDISDGVPKCKCDNVSEDVNGVCTPCRPASFKHPFFAVCVPCLVEKCMVCSNDNFTCNQCMAGYQFQSVSAKCKQICGDGKRFDHQCDDGNNIEGDGCSSVCKIEPQYICKGGSPTTKDICTKVENLTASIVSGFPLIISPGILIDFYVNPVFQKLTTQDIYNLFSIGFSNPMDAPRQIVITQHPSQNNRFRVFLLYPIQLPMTVINIKFVISKQPYGRVQIQRTLDVLGSGISSALQFGKDILS